MVADVSGRMLTQNHFTPSVIQGVWKYHVLSDEQVGDGTVECSAKAGAATYFFRKRVQSGDGEGSDRG